MYKAKTRTEIADEYGINRKTLMRWLKQAGIHLSGRILVSPIEQQQIYSRFGRPVPPQGGNDVRGQRR